MFLHFESYVCKKSCVPTIRIIIFVSGLDGGMQSSAKDLYWFWWIMSGYLLGPRILSLLLVLCCSTKAIIFCLRSLSESIHKWILGISSFSQLKVEKTFLAISHAKENTLFFNFWWSFCSSKKPGGLYMWYFIFFQEQIFLNPSMLLPILLLKRDKKEFIEPLEKWKNL